MYAKNWKNKKRKWYPPATTYEPKTPVSNYLFVIAGFLILLIMIASMRQPAEIKYGSSEADLYPASSNLTDI